MYGSSFTNGKSESEGLLSSESDDSEVVLAPEVQSEETPKRRKKGEKWSCWDRCIFYLSSREHSRNELELKCRRAKHTPEEIEETLSKLEEKDYLNEQRYFRSRVRQLILRRWGPQKIKAAIAKARVAWNQDVFLEIQAEQSPQDQPEEQVQSLIAKKLGALSMQKRRQEYLEMNEGYEKRKSLFSIKDKLLRSIASQGFSAFEYQNLIDDALADWLKS